MRNSFIGWILFLTIGIFSCTQDKQVFIEYDLSSSMLTYGVNQLSELLNSDGYTIEKTTEIRGKGIKIIILTKDQDIDEDQEEFLSINLPELKPDGFILIRKHETLFILSPSKRGALYGIMDLMEQIGPSCDFTKLEEKEVNPVLAFRAIKFNLPWSPYRPGPATDVHLETCRDLKFWETFLDMMVKNRFNALSLWNTHPFPYMIRAKNYPRATPFSDAELAEWQSFWKKLFKMAKDRGIETYLVNWNIVVSPAFSEAYGAKEYDDRSELVRKYTRESVTQVINEYEDLTGLGVTLADWMGNWGDDKMTPVAREDWIEETFVEGMKQADRKVKFIHRAVLAGDPIEMRRVIDHAALPDKTIVEIKFNWSHAHSTPKLSLTHANDEGTIMRAFWDPKPENYFIAWMMRNEDFFVLRWGDPDFIRAHILTNHPDYADGYFIGSEGYIPAKDYSYNGQLPKTWNYAFEKQWMFYYLWGRLLYNPEETDVSLAKAFEIRYPKINDMVMLEAYALASKVPLYFASFYKGTWDFTLYSEGFLAPWQAGFDDQKSPFISIEELIRHETLDHQYLNIEDYCRMIHDRISITEGAITPIMLAQKLDETCTGAMLLINKLRTGDSEPTLDSELDDLETWSQLGFYLADKIRAGVAFETYRRSGVNANKEESLKYLQNCVSYWKNVIRLTESRYQPMPYVSMGHHEPRWPEFTQFHWKYFLKDIEADIDYVKNTNYGL